MSEKPDNLPAHQQPDAAAGERMMREPTDRPELPACAALRLLDGTTFAAMRHHQCISMVNVVFGTGAQSQKASWEMGFMTTKGRFVDRREAYRMMIDNNILSACPIGYINRFAELFSEDLY